MIRYIRFAIVSLALVFSVSALSAPLKSVLEAFLVVTETENGKSKEILVSVDRAEPGSVIEYVLTYTNESNEALTGFAIKTPVPVNTTYVADSAASKVRSKFMVSVDEGKTFETEPVTRTVIENGKAKEIVIPASEYDAVSWDVSKKLKAKKSMVMRYRVSID